MTAQLSLAFDQTLADRFVQFHEANPTVYQTLLHLSREWVRRRSGQKCSISMLFETARWLLSLETESVDEFRLNNTHRAFYSRLLMLNHPELSGLFDLRYAPEADAWIAERGAV